MIKLIESRDPERLVPLLREAEEGDARIIQAIEDPAITAYVVQDGEKTVGAVVMRWGDESEILYIATEAALRGQGYGKLIIRALIDAGRQKQVKALIVGTSNSSWNNIAFYQKCGFRMHAVRKDFFDYVQPPLYEDGIRMQDMLVLRCELNRTL